MKDPNAHERPMVLVVDDDQHLLRQTRVGLQRAGFEALTAVHGRDALRKIKGTRPAAIILDLEMPEMDGEAFLRVLKGDRKAREIPVILLTGRSMTTEELQRLKSGSQLLLRKPIEISALVDHLRSLIGGVGPARASSVPTRLPEHQEERVALVDQYPRQAGKGGLVLVIDDEVQHLRQLRMGLIRAGYEVETARDGEEGIAKMGKRRPKAIVLDLEMPGMDGMRFLQIVKGHPAVQDIPIVVLTGRTEYETMKESYDRGSDLFLNKPVEIDQLVRTIERARRRSG